MKLSKLILGLQAYELAGHGDLECELYTNDFSDIEDIYLMAPENEDKFIAIRG